MSINKNVRIIVFLVVLLLLVGCGEKETPSEDPKPSGTFFGNDWHDFEPELALKRVLKMSVTRWLNGDLRKGELYPQSTEEEHAPDAFVYEEAVALVPKGTITYDENIMGSAKMFGLKTFTLHATITSEDGTVLKKYEVIVNWKNNGLQLCKFTEE